MDSSDSSSASEDGLHIINLTAVTYSNITIKMRVRLGNITQTGHGGFAPMFQIHTLTEITDIKLIRAGTLSPDLVHITTRNAGDYMFHLEVEERTQVGAMDTLYELLLYGVMRTADYYLLKLGGLPKHRFTFNIIAYHYSSLEMINFQARR